MRRYVSCSKILEDIRVHNPEMTALRASCWNDSLLICLRRFFGIRVAGSFYVSDFLSQEGCVFSLILQKIMEKIQDSVISSVNHSNKGGCNDQ